MSKSTTMIEENKGVEEKCLIQPKDGKERLEDEDESSKIENPENKKQDEVFFILSNYYQKAPYQVNKSYVLGMPETIIFNPGEHVVVDTGVMIIHARHMSMMLSLRCSLMNSGLSLMGVSFNPESHALQIKVVNTTTIPVQVTHGCAIASVFFYDGYIHPHIAQEYGIAVNAKAISKDHTDSIKEKIEEYSDAREYTTGGILLERVI